MAKGRYKTYNWQDIKDLIIKDMGQLEGAKAEIWYLNGFAGLSDVLQPIVRCEVEDPNPVKISDNPKP